MWNVLIIPYAEGVLRFVKLEILLVAVRVVALLLAALALQLVIYGVLPGVLPQSILPGR